MTDQQFDNLLRDKLGSYTEEVGEDLWAGIAKGLDRKARIRRVKWISITSVAAAACLVGGLFIFRGVPQETPIVNVNGAPAFAETEIIDNAEPSDPANIVKPISEQINSLGTNVAEAVVPKVEIPQVVIPQIETSEESEPTLNVEPAETLAEEPEKSAEVVEQYIVDDTRTAEIDWNALSDEDEITSTHKSLIAINSNISSISKEGGILQVIAPSYSPGKDGISAVSSVEAKGTPKFHMPVTFGLQFKTNLFDKVYAGAGLSYTYLLSEYEGMVSKQHFKTIYSKLHYVGIPVAFSYNFIDTQWLGVYAKVGGAIEKCISSEYVYGSNLLKEKVQGVQLSANAGIGIEYWFINRMGIYFDPSVAYYFDNNQPLSIRTDQPLQLHLEAGLRFRL